MVSRPISRAESLDILESVARARGVSAQSLTMLQYIMVAESGGEQYAANPKSKARGCFQFIEGTWLGMLKMHGVAAGYGKYAEHIHWTSKGWTIDDPKLREEALNLRYDVKASCEMGVALTRMNGEKLKQALGREPTAGELYLAHFLGDRDAVRVLQHPDANTPIRSLLAPIIMSSNSDVEFKKAGATKSFAEFTVADIQQWAARKMEQELSYDQLSAENRRQSWRRRNPRAPEPGKPDDYGDMEEASGNMTMVESFVKFVVQLVSGIATAIGSVFNIGDGTPTPPPATPPRVATHTPNIPPRA